MNTKSCITKYSAEGREACSKAEAKKLQLQNFYSRQRERHLNCMNSIQPLLVVREVCVGMKGGYCETGAAYSRLESLAELEVPGPSFYSGLERRKEQ